MSSNYVHGAEFSPVIRAIGYLHIMVIKLGSVCRTGYVLNIATRAHFWAAGVQMRKSSPTDGDVSPDVATLAMNANSTAYGDLSTAG